MTSYAFSLDHAVWSGPFSTRQAAMEAGLEAARHADMPPETIFVGQRITPNDRAYGHGRDIANTMRRRVQEDNGDLADQFLRKVTDKQLADLDNALEATIKGWMEANQLAPSWVRIEAVSEYPVTAALLAEQ